MADILSPTTEDLAALDIGGTMYVSTRTTQVTPATAEFAALDIGGSQFVSIRTTTVTPPTIWGGGVTPVAKRWNPTNSTWDVIPPP